MLELPTLTDASERLSLLVLSVLVCLAALLALLRHFQAFWKHHASHPHLDAPPTTWPWLKNTIDVMRHESQMHDWVLAHCERFQGRPWTYSVLGSAPAIVFSDPRAIEDILKAKFWHFEKGPLLREILHDLVGDGVFAVDGDMWVMQRKTASRLFTMRELRDSMALAVQRHALTLCAMLDRVASEAGRVDLSRLLSEFTMMTFCSIGFGIDLDCLGHDGAVHPFQTALDRAQYVTRLRMSRPRWFWRLQRWLGIGAEGILRADMPVIDSVVYRIINDSMQQQRQRTHPHPAAPATTTATATGDPTRGQETRSARGKQNLVSLFLDTEQASSHEVDAKFLRDIVVGFLLAGRDTTAQTMSWFFLCLSQHADVERKVVEELTAHFGEAMCVPDMEQVQSLVYLDAVLHETLRLYPPVPFNFKSAVQDTVLTDGTFVPSGTHAVFPSYALGRMAHVWGPDAKTFDPLRWIDAATQSVRTESPFKFLAFHAGPRRCLGKNLAMLELKIVLATLLQRFAFHVDEPERVTYGISLTLPMKSPLLVRVTKRECPSPSP